MIVRYLRWLRKTHGIGTFGDKFWSMTAHGSRRVLNEIKIDFNAEPVSPDEVF